MDRGLLIKPVDPVSLGIPLNIPMPMAKDVVITARPAELWQHIMLSHCGERGEHALFVAFNESPIHSSRSSCPLKIIDKPPAVDVPADGIAGARGLCQV